MSDKFPYEVFYLSIDNGLSSELKQWLVENIGLPYHTWRCEYGGIGYTKFKFLREEDAIVFALKWS